MTTPGEIRTEMVRGADLTEGDVILFAVPDERGGHVSQRLVVTGQRAVELRVFGAADVFARVLTAAR
jgi:hypothetical protein